MICPRCGYEMKEEHLYCERCGAEIQIVPDFEPEIQNSIEETLSTVAWEINPDLSENSSDLKKKPQEEDFLKEGNVFRGITSRKRILITTLTSILMTLVIILLAGLIYQNYSVNYQIREAEERMEKAQYENALTCLVKAEKLQPEDTGIPYMQAQCYYELGEADRAAEILENVVFKRSMDEERKIQYFDFIITILAGQQNYERISELLMESGDTAVQTQFQHYMAMKPEFGYSTGNYEKVISLKITANTTGTIYYTTDGSEPQEHSLVYTAPIQLEPGEQGCLAGGKLTKREVDVDMYTAWITGRMVFKSIRLGDMLKHLARWYDVDIMFAEERLKEVSFTGAVKKYDDFTEVLDVIESTQVVRFRIEDRTIIVY